MTTFLAPDMGAARERNIRRQFSGIDAELEAAEERTETYLNTAKIKKFLAPDMDAARERNEQRSEMYIRYIERVAQFLTKRGAMKVCGASCLARGQANLVWRLI